MKPIDPAWLQEYIDALRHGVETFGPDSAMGKAILHRAEALMDMVKKWKEHSKG